MHTLPRMFSVQLTIKVCDESLVYTSIFTTRCTIVQSAVLRSHVVCPSVCLSVCLSVCPSVTLVDQDHIGWKSWKLIARSLFVAQRSSIYSQGSMEKFRGENVRSTRMSITSGWIESTENHVILGGDVAVCLLLSAHCAVIFAIAQLSCFHYNHRIFIEQRGDWLVTIVTSNSSASYSANLQIFSFTGISTHGLKA